MLVEALVPLLDAVPGQALCQDGEGRAILGTSVGEELHRLHAQRPSDPPASLVQHTVDLVQGPTEDGGEVGVSDSVPYVQPQRVRVLEGQAVESPPDERLHLRGILGGTVARWGHRRGDTAPQALSTDERVQPGT